MQKKKKSEIGVVKTERGVWVNGEVRTSSLVFGIYGATAGFIICSVFTLFLYYRFDLTEAPEFLKLFIPLMGAIVGGIVGTVVGIGTPRTKYDPQQGRLVSWRRFFARKM